MVSVIVVRALVETVEATGVSRAEFCARAGLELSLLESPGARLELEQFERVVVAATELTGDPTLGLHFAERISAPTVGVLAHMTGHAPTVREAITVCSEFAGLAIEGMRFAIQDDADVAVVRCEFPRVGGLLDQVVAELMMAGLARLTYTFLGPSEVIRSAAFEHERPKASSEYSRMFGPNVTFRREATLLALDKHEVERRQLNHDAELYGLLRMEAERRRERAATGTPVAARLRQYLLTIPPDRFPEVAAAAHALGTSVRSLRRRLVAEGTSYREVLQSLLEVSANRLLQDPTRSVKETAAILGFGDAPAFVRAFRRWTGKTPGEYRRVSRGE